MERLFMVALAVCLCACGSNGLGPDGEPDPKHDEGDLVIDLPGGVKMAFIWLEPGTFLYGILNPSPNGNDHPQREVTIEEGFYLGKYEVTRAQWESVMGPRAWGDSLNSRGANYPAKDISDSEARRFVRKLDELLSEDGVRNFQLPSEIQWEYACRGGTITDWPFMDVDLLPEYVWYDRNSDGYAHKVGTRMPNPWGFYDMSGNVKEWMSDTTGPSGSIPSHRISRGGAYSSVANNTRCVSRAHSTGAGVDSNGLRVLRLGPKIAMVPK